MHSGIVSNILLTSCICTLDDMCYSIYFPIFISILILKSDDDRSIDLSCRNISLHRLVHEHAEFPLHA
jgi:hypothetical protein